jgi:hypothetical protein
MEFGIDYSEATEGSGLLPEGKYEVIIKYAGEDATKNKTVYINVTCVIRNDVDQKYQNKYLWHSLWHRKEPSQADLAVGGYSIKQIQTLSKAAGLPNGKKYPTLEEWCIDLKDKAIQVTIQHEEYPVGSGTMQTQVQYVNPSKYPECNHMWKTKEDSAAISADDNNDFVEIAGDDDLPF